jgi:dihydroorotate dehydrogenase (fumarate)
MIDLATKYLGLQLRSPIVASSSPLSQDLDNLRKLEAAGAGAVVMHSLYEEQIMLDAFWMKGFLSQGSDGFPEAMSYFPDRNAYAVDPAGYLKHLEAARKAVKMPVIGSLNGVSTGGWIRYAREIESAGADALELNIYYLATSLQTTAQEVEQSYGELVRDIKNQVRIPVSVKLSPYFTAVANMCRQLVLAGVDGLVLFNRFYQPDIDLDAQEVRPTLKLSNSSELLPRLRWLAVLAGRVRASLSCSGGVHTAEDAIKALMAGAHTVQVVSALLQHGPEYLATLKTDMLHWLEEHEFDSLAQLRGSLSLQRCPQPQAFERSNYMRVLQTWRQGAAPWIAGT